MTNYKMKYGKGQVDISVPEKNRIGIIEGKSIESSNSEEEIILNALDNTIGSAKLSELVHPEIGRASCRERVS